MRLRTRAPNTPLARVEVLPPQCCHRMMRVLPVAPSMSCPPLWSFPRSSRRVSVDVEISKAKAKMQKASFAAAKQHKSQCGGFPDQGFGNRAGRREVKLKEGSGCAEESQLDDAGESVQMHLYRDI